MEENSFAFLVKKMQQINEPFDFAQIVHVLYQCSIFQDSMKKIYQPYQTTADVIKGRSTPGTRKIGVYALYEHDKLQKIGKAADRSGIFHRMGQYYRGDKEGGCDYIDDHNRDEIEVKYFNLDSAEQCWVAERTLQVIAYYMGEEMPWESKK